MAKYMVKITRKGESVKYYGPYRTKKIAQAKLKEHMGSYKIPGRSGRVVLASNVPTIRRK